MASSRRFISLDLSVGENIGATTVRNTDRTRSNPVCDEYIHMARCVNVPGSRAYHRIHELKEKRTTCLYENGCN